MASVIKTSPITSGIIVVQIWVIAARLIGCWYLTTNSRHLPVTSEVVMDPGEKDSCNLTDREPRRRLCCIT